MPNTTPPPSKRERLARFILRLRSKRTSGSSLVVQTGFPTSLADLVVKNRAKFKKRRKPSPSHSSDLDSAASATARSASDGAGDRRAPAAESRDRIDVAIEAAPVPMRRRGGGLGLGFLVVKVAALVVLAVGGKRVVVGITVFTFGLLVLQVSGLLRLRWSKERNAIDERFDLGGRGLVSPIREFDDRWNFGCLDSKSEILLESRDFDANLSRLRSNESNNLRGRELVCPVREIESESHQNSLQSQSDGSGNSDLAKSRKSRVKKLFRKLFKTKNREKKDGKESSSSLDDGRFKTEEVLTEAEEGSGNGDEVKDISDDEFFSFEDDNYDTKVTEINSEVVNEIQDDGGEIRLGRWRKLVFIVVVLLGLLGGKGLALVMTVVLYLLSGCTGTVWKKWKMR